MTRTYTEQASRRAWSDALTTDRGRKDAPALDEDDLVASTCRDSLEDFVREFWDEVVPQPLVWNWHMTCICEALQRVAERVFAGKPKLYDLIVNVPPGTSKSTICSVMFPAWTWTRMQSAITIGVSYTERLALNLARKQRELIRSDKYQRVFGLGKLKVDQDLKGHYENEQGGARISFGTGGTTGYHAHFLIVDDPLNPNEAASETELRSCNDWMDSTLFTRKVDKEVSATILIMQRLHQADPTQHMLDRANDDNPIKHIRLPGELVAGIEPVPVSLREHYVDGLLDVHRLKRRQLAELRIKLGDYGYASQILQVPVPPEGGTFIVERFRIAHPTVTIVRQARFWDKAATPGKGDWCAGVLVGRDINNAWWVLDVRRGRWDTHTREQVIRDTAERDGAATLIGIEQEPGSGGVDSAWMTISNLDGFNVRAFRSTGSKVERATPVSVQVNARNFLIAAQASWLSDFISELHHFPFGLHDDQVDALAGAFNMLAGVGPRKRAGALMRRRVVRPPSPDDRATTIQA